MTFAEFIKRGGNRIKQCRDAFNIAQKEIAAEIGCQPKTLQRIEAGKTKSLKTTEKAADYMEVDARVLFIITDDEFQEYLNKAKRDYINIK